MSLKKQIKSWYDISYFFRNSLRLSKFKNFKRPRVHPIIFPDGLWEFERVAKSALLRRSNTAMYILLASLVNQPSNYVPTYSGSHIFWPYWLINSVLVILWRRPSLHFEGPCKKPTYIEVMSAGWLVGGENQVRPIFYIISQYAK